MKIALIVPGVGGVHREGHERSILVLQALIERLARKHEIVVIPLDQKDKSRYRLLSATVATLGPVTGLGPAGRWLNGFRQLISLLRSEPGRFDVLHAFWVGRHAAWAVAAGRLLRARVAVSIGGGELVWLPEIGYGGAGSWLGRAKTSVTLRLADAASACSRYSLEPLHKIRSDALWLPWGVDWRLFDSPVPRDPGPPWRLLNVASLNRVKDQATLLRAIRLLIDRGVDVKVDCVGEDTMGGGLQRMAVNLGIEDFATFHGYQPVERLRDYYRQAHLNVLTSLFENTPAVVLEAGAAGLPTVGSAVGLIPEMAPRAALAVAPRDPEALAEGISSLLRAPDERERLGRAAQEFARTYDADWTAAELDKLYARLAGRSNGP